MSAIPHRWDDDLFDSMALAEAVREDRTGDIAVILRNANPYALAVTLAKLVAEVLDEQDVPAGHFRLWAPLAQGRS